MSATPTPPAKAAVRAMLAASLAETRTPTTTFTPHRDGVLMDRGAHRVLLTPAQVSDMLDLYQREALAADAEADRCRRLFNALWEARCEAIDRCGAPVGAV